MSVRLGVSLPQFTGRPEDLVNGALRAEALGLDSVWVFDHLWPLTGGKQRPVAEAWTSLACVAEATSSVTVGTLVTRSTLRNPVVLARMAATVADVAAGRLVVGIGSGDAASRPENEAFGLPYFSGRARIEQLEATVGVLRDSVPDVPVWIGGRSGQVIDMAARRAHGWNSWGGTPAEFGAGVARLRAGSSGRSVRATWGCQAVIASSAPAARDKLKGRSPATYLVGGPAEIAHGLAAVAAAGASHLVIAFPDAGATEPYELLAEKVRPALMDTP